MILRTYQLKHLRVGEAGKSQTVISILHKLLPSGSAMNADPANNSLHVLTSPAAHQAAWEYLSAVDIADAAVPRAEPIPDEVKAALLKLGELADHSPQIGRALEALKADVGDELAAIDARQRRLTYGLLAGGVALLGCSAIALWWLSRLRAATPAVPPAPSTAIALAPEDLKSALVPMHEKMRGDMLGLLNEVAIKLQAQHHEQQKLVLQQQRQIDEARQALVEERKQFIAETGSMVVEAVGKVDATTARLAKQQDKVAELVEELQVTVRELDATKDNLRAREIELEQERSKIAALSILLEEGAAPPSLSGATAERQPVAHRPESPAVNGHVTNGVRPLNPSPCKTNSPVTLPLRAAEAAPAARTTPARYQFLPPDHPET